MRASHKVAHLIAEAAKPYNEGEFIKKCLITAAEEVAPETVPVF